MTGYRQRTSHSSGLSFKNKLLDMKNVSKGKWLRVWFIVYVFEGEVVRPSRIEASCSFCTLKINTTERLMIGSQQSFPYIYSVYSVCV